MSQESGIFGLAAGTKAAKKADAARRLSTKDDTKQKKLPPFNVILLNDDEHTFEYVIQLLRSVFAYSDEMGYQLAKQVDESKRAIVFTTHRELAELKREQIHGFGTDHRVATCKGSMSAVIEPASA